MHQPDDDEEEEEDDGTLPSWVIRLWLAYLIHAGAMVGLGILSEPEAWRECCGLQIDLRRQLNEVDQPLPNVTAMQSFGKNLMDPLSDPDTVFVPTIIGMSGMASTRRLQFDSYGQYEYGSGYSGAPNKKSTPINTILLGIGPAIHVLLLPIFMCIKKSHGKAQSQRSMAMEETRLDDDATSVIFNIKFTLGQKIFIFFIGNIIDLGSFLIGLWKIIGLDLSNFWFPMPFFEFFKAKCQVKNYRIKGARVRLNASPADAYFLFLSQALWNFCERILCLPSNTTATQYMYVQLADPWSLLADTLGFYERCSCAMSYNKWLDKRVEWYGVPPEGTTNEFVIFNDKLKCPLKLALKLMGICFGFVPGFQVISSFFSYKWRLSNLMFGGITPHFGESYTMGEFFMKYVTTLFWGLGFCSAWERVWVDEQIQVHTGFTPMAQP